MRAWELFNNGWKQDAIAEALGVSESSVSKWVKKGKAGGSEALRAKSGQGRIAKLSDEQRKKIPELLLRGAESYGFTDGKWTYARVAEVIRREFGGIYTPKHTGRILVAEGWRGEEEGE
jgi:transposase